MRNKTPLLKDTRKVQSREYQISFAGRDPCLDSSWMQRGRKRKEKREREERDKAVFKRVLTPRQDRDGSLSAARRRASRITAPRVSRNPGLYANTGPGRRSPRILGLAALTSSPEPARRTGPSSSEADATDVRARCTQGPSSGTSFSRLRRGRAVRAHATLHVLCRYLREDSPRLASLLSLIYLSAPIARGLIVSARSAVIRHAGILTDRSAQRE